MSKLAVEIERIKTELLKLSKPLKIIQFGSSVKGQLHENSDIDILIIVPDSTDGKALNLKIQTNLKRNDFPLDLIVVPESYFNQRKEWFGTLYWYAEKEGKALYERDIA